MTEIMLSAAPPSWLTVRLGQIFRERKEKVSDTEFPPLSVTKRGIVPQLETAAKSDAGDNRKAVYPSDFVINSRSDRKGSAGVSSLRGSVSLISIVLEPTKVDPTFAHHLLRSYAFGEEFYRWGHGIVADLWTTRWSDMKNIRLALPDLPTQKAIAAFLDRETARIDQLIQKKQRMVELLGEREKERLRQAITPGRALGSCSFSRNWFGNVPSHWTTKPLRRLIYFQRGHDLPADQRVPGDIPIVSSGGPSGWHNAAMACGPSIVTGRYGSIGSFHLIEGPFWPLNTSLYSLRISGDPLFVLYLLKGVSDLFEVMSLKSAVPGIDRNDIHGVSVPIPPLSEQRAVAAQLRQRELEDERIAETVQLSIDRLKEYRSALITAAVTGQIDLETWSRRGEGDRRLDAIQEEMAG